MTVRLVLMIMLTTMKYVCTCRMDLLGSCRLHNAHTTCLRSYPVTFNGIPVCSGLKPPMQLLQIALQLIGYISTNTCCYTVVHVCAPMHVLSQSLRIPSTYPSYCFHIDYHKLQAHSSFTACVCVTFQGSVYQTQV